LKVLSETGGQHFELIVAHRQLKNQEIAAVVGSRGTDEARFD
jgi:hypothetical protein